MKLKKLKGLEDLGMERFFYSTSSQQEKWSFWKRILSVNALVTFIEDILKDLIIYIDLDLISSIMINVDMHQVIQKLDNLGYYLLEFMLNNIHNLGIVITKPGFTYSKSTVKTPYAIGVVDLVLVSLLLRLSRFYTLLYVVSIVDLEQSNVGWDSIKLLIRG